MCEEQVGVRQYYADPEKGDQELAIFGTAGLMPTMKGSRFIS
ncbi:hypothetical protein ACRQ5D_11770 [Mucilaginibacter sp. P25]|nr:hypothetical protein [Mucilaginibacter gossypii]